MKNSVYFKLFPLKDQWCFYFPTLCVHNIHMPGLRHSPNNPALPPQHEVCIRASLIGFTFPPSFIFGRIGKERAKHYLEIGIRALKNKYRKWTFQSLGKSFPSSMKCFFCEGAHPGLETMQCEWVSSNLCKMFWMGMKYPVHYLSVALHVGHWQHGMTYKELYSGFTAPFAWHAPTWLLLVWRLAKCRHVKVLLGLELPIWSSFSVFQVLCPESQ